LNERGETAIVRAILDGNIDMVKLLLEKGADPNVTVIDPNVKFKTDDFVIYTGLDPSFRGNIDYGGGKRIIRRTEMDLILGYRREIDILGFGPPPRALLEQLELQFTTAISIARKKGYTEIANLLRGIDLIDAAQKGDTAGVNALLNEGVDVNAKDKYGYTALMYASKEGHTETVKALLEKGADVNAKSKKGTTALIVASDKGRTEIVKLLKEAAAAAEKKEEKKKEEKEEKKAAKKKAKKKAKEARAIEKKPPSRGKICCNTSDGTTICQEGMFRSEFKQTLESRNYGPCER
jgi:hypothetical protein